jgi:hypothetical protein
MRVIGTGPDAARLFETPGGIQIRRRGRIISGGPGTARELRRLLEAAMAAGRDPLAVLDGLRAAAAPDPAIAEDLVADRADRR